MKYDDNQSECFHSRNRFNVEFIYKLSQRGTRTSKALTLVWKNLNQGSLGACVFCALGVP